MDRDAKEQIAQEKFGKSFEELGTNEQKAVGGTSRKTGHMSAEEKEEVAQEKFGKSYEELGTNEQKAVGGSHKGVVGSTHESERS